MLFSDKEIPADTCRAVNRAVGNMRLPQSVMLSGGSQKLREKSARELCLAALCRNITKTAPVPCGKCSSCKKVLAGTHPDIITAHPTGTRKTISIDDIREQIFGPLCKSPTEADNKVFLFTDADGLSVQIQNALLKTIEEPPEDAMFIFLCEKRESMLTTVISRLTEYALGDTLSSKSRTEDEKVREAAADIARCMAKENEYALMLKTAVMQKNRKMMSQVAEKLTAIVRDALVENSGAQLLSGCEEEAFMLSASFSAPSLLKIKAAMDTIIANAAANANENLLITRFSSSLALIMKERK